jgi:hypothetical protein
VLLLLQLLLLSTATVYCYCHYYKSYQHEFALPVLEPITARGEDDMLLAIVKSGLAVGDARHTHVTCACVDGGYDGGGGKIGKRDKRGKRRKRGERHKTGKVKERRKRGKKGKRGHLSA